jgi:hypothetical protein
VGWRSALAAAALLPACHAAGGKRWELADSLVRLRPRRHAASGDSELGGPPEPQRHVGRCARRGSRLPEAPPCRRERVPQDTDALRTHAVER